MPIWKPRTESAPTTEITRNSWYHAGRLRREDVLAQALAVLERIDAREVDALVVVGVGADEAAEQERLCDDEPGQGHELDTSFHRSKSYAGRTIATRDARKGTVLGLADGARVDARALPTRGSRPRAVCASVVSPGETSSRR